MLSIEKVHDTPARGKPCPRRHAPGRRYGWSIEAPRFTSRADFESWLERRHGRSAGIWLEAALCFGWIDGQKARGDDTVWLQRFTPRSRRSRWSRINRDRAERLLGAGRIRQAGLEEIERARSDGRWDAAYEGQRTARTPDDLRRSLEADPAAAAAFAKLDARNRFAIIWRLDDANRPDTRARRLAAFLDMLRRGVKIH